jgi:purine-binding chemotaxis protein CheW
VENPDNIGSDRYLTFTLGEAVFAIGIHSVREILDYLEITRIPHSPDCMKGVVNVRGSAVPVIDLGLAFGLSSVQHTQNTRIVIVELQRDDRVALAGALADSVQEVLEIGPAVIFPPPVSAGEVLQGIARIDERFLLILDVDRVFSREDMQQLDGVLSTAPGVDQGLAATAGGTNQANAG